jgi:NAD(P)-dependent dehydrogenase (short-subunit alcohol dehydrogenase family)
MATVVDSTDEEWQICLDVNLTGAYNCIKAVLPSMLERKQGRIVATASLAARGGVNQGLGYVASKWGLIGLIKTVAIECGPYGITANAVCPTNCNTPMFRNDAINRFFRPDLENPQFSDIEDIARGMHPLGVPFIEPDDVSHALLFLLSDEARYVSGEALHISAGQIATNTA